MILIDTSAIYANLSSSEKNHEIASQTWKDHIKNDTRIFTPNYVIVETISLVQNRLGMRSIFEFQMKMVPFINIEWITASQHQEIMNNFQTANRRKLSLVDCASFVTMRRLGIQKVFTFDRHFADQGFQVLPTLP